MGVHVGQRHTRFGACCFPSALELITGKFLRHSPAFYEWRIKDREAKLTTDPDNPALYDDLAVAHDKLGHHDKAIELMQTKEHIYPGLYETQANLGTFLIHAGKFKEGLIHIDNALSINPDAHFGRERYQKWLVEYVIEVGYPESKTLPLRGTDPYSDGFSQFLCMKLDLKHYLPEKELQAAHKGLLGMMRFGNHDSPILLEALGDVMQSEPYPQADGKLIAARCYLIASYRTENEESCEQYRKMAEHALCLHRKMTIQKLESELKEELADANAWYAKLKQQEQQWIDNGDDVEAQFNKLYQQEPSVVGEIAENGDAPPLYNWPLIIAVGSLMGIAGLVIAGMLAFMIARWIWRRL